MDAPQETKKIRVKKPKGRYQPHHLLYAGFVLVLLFIVLFLFALMNISDVWDTNATAAISVFSAGLAAAVTAWLLDVASCRRRNVEFDRAQTAVYNRLKFGLASLADAYSQLYVGYNTNDATATRLWTDWADALLTYLNHMSSPAREIEINKAAKELAKWIQLPFAAAEVLEYDGPILVSFGLFGERQVTDISMLKTELGRALDTLMSSTPGTQFDKMRELRNLLFDYFDSHSIDSMKELNTIAHEPKKLYYLSATR